MTDEVTGKIDSLGGWQGETLARVRKLITQHLEHTLADLRTALRPAAGQGTAVAKKRVRR